MQTQLQLGRELSSDMVLDPAGSNSADRLRILHVISFLGRGGAEMGMLKLIRGLPEWQFEHRICATRGLDEGFVRGRLADQKIYVAGSSQPKLQFPLFRLLNIIRQCRPHIVHSRNWGSIEAIFAAKLAGVPVAIHSEHGYEVDMFTGLPLRRRVFRRAAYAMSDGVFAVTRELRDFHARQASIRPERIGVIYNGVYCARFFPSPECKHATRKELGLPADSFVIGSVGRLVPIKDHQTLLNAAAILANCGVNVRVILAGSGPERKHLEAQATGPLADRVCFIGDTDRVPEFLNAMDVFVLPSLGEGMSNTLLEAMACGLAVAATNVGGNPEIVEHGLNGWLFKPRDTLWLAEKLKELAMSPTLRENTGAAARSRAVDCFSLQGMLENYRKYYLQLAPRCGPVVGGRETAHVRN